jgi:hypothetical protein
MDRFWPEWCHFKVEYLREFQVICKKALTLYQGPRGSCLMKRKPEVEKLVTLSL